MRLLKEKFSETFKDGKTVEAEDAVGGLICFPLTDGNSQRKLITLPSRISTSVRDAIGLRVCLCVGAPIWFPARLGC